MASPPREEASSNQNSNIDEIQPELEETDNNPQIQNNTEVKKIDFDPIFNPLSGS